jgi:hypothetical protein
MTGVIKDDQDPAGRFLRGAGTTGSGGHAANDLIPDGLEHRCAFRGVSRDACRVGGADRAGQVHTKP